MIDKVPKGYASPEEVAKYLNVNQRTVLSWIRTGKIPKHTYIHIGRTYRIDIDKLLDAIQTPPPQLAHQDDLELDAEINLDFNDDDDGER